MVDSLKAFIVAAGTLLALSNIALAAELRDPTQPPAAAARPVASLPGVAAPAPAPLVLQSVLTGPGRRASVIINGRVVELGEAFDHLRLMQVTESRATLTGPRGSTVLALTPGADKQLAAAPAAERTLARASGAAAPATDRIATAEPIDAPLRAAAPSTVSVRYAEPK